MDNPRRKVACWTRSIIWELFLRVKAGAARQSHLMSVIANGVKQSHKNNCIFRKRLPRCTRNDKDIILPRCTRNDKDIRLPRFARNDKDIRLPRFARNDKDIRLPRCTRNDTSVFNIMTESVT